MKTFMAAVFSGMQERKYISEFKLFGETFVIAHSFPGSPNKAWQAFHKETGYIFGPICKTSRETEKEATAFLKSKGERALKKAIRKAKREIKKQEGEGV